MPDLNEVRRKQKLRNQGRVYVEEPITYSGVLYKVVKGVGVLLIMVVWLYLVFYLISFGKPWNEKTTTWEDVAPWLGFGIFVVGIILLVAAGIYRILKSSRQTELLAETLAEHPVNDDDPVGIK